MDRQVLEPHEDRHAKQQPKDTEGNANQQQIMAIHAEEGNGGEVGNLQRGLAARLSSRLRQRAAGGQKQQSGKGCESFRKAASHRRKIGVPSAH